MLNNITLIGRWSKDNEIIQANNGTEILNATLAVSDPYDKENVTFVDVKAFKKTAVNAHQFTKKGSKVGIVGKLQQEKWQNKEGQNRSKHVVIANQIVFLDEKGDGQQNQQSNQQSKPDEPIEMEPEDLDGLPF